MTLVKGITLDVQTGELWEYEEDIELPNPRISEIENRLKTIRMELQATDYKAIKFGEGALTEEEYAPIRLERQTLRDEYNTLEAELETLR